MVRTRPVIVRRAQTTNQTASQPIAMTANGFRAMAVAGSPWARAWMARSDPQPGQ